MLSGERAEQQLQTGDRTGAAALLDRDERSTSGVGLMPEQAWENPDLAASPFGTDPTTASIGFVNGKPAGSSSPLTWAQAQQARLIAGAGRRPAAGAALDRPRPVRAVRGRRGRCR